MRPRWSALPLFLVLLLGGAGMAQGQRLYRMDGEILFPDKVSLAVVDMSTFGAESPVAELGTSAQQLAYDPTTEGLLAYDAEDGLFRIDPETGQTTVVGGLGVEVDVLGLTVDIEGTPWALAIDFSSGDGTAQYQLLKLDPTTGAVAAVLQLSDFSLQDIAAVGTRLIGFASTGHLVEVDPVTGQTIVGPPIAPPGVRALSTGPNHDSLILLTSPELHVREVHQVEPDTGTSEFLGNLLVFDSMNHPALIDIATAPARGVTEVPTLGSVGIAILTTLLAIAGLLIQRRGS